MPSLLEALEEKYGLGCNNAFEESEVSIFVPKLPPLLCVPELLVLNDCNIDCAGDSNILREKCRSVKELDLAQNNLQNWNEILQILSHMPKVEFVNLSKNRLNSPLPPSPSDCFSNLKSIVLNGTCLDWDCVVTLLKYLPVLQELHLSLNDFEHVLIDTIDDDVIQTNSSEIHEFNNDDEKNENVFPTDENTINKAKLFHSFQKTSAHSGVKKLHFTGNPVKDWAEICRLGRVFPNLEALVLAECPLRAVAPVPRPSLLMIKTSDTSAADHNNSEPPHAHFKNLSFLNLSSTNINTWDDIDRLAQFPRLHNLRVQNWPLWDKCDATEHERRQLLIARLPFVQTLNGGGEISTQEREDAERAFIRYYMDRPESDRSERYNELTSKHGTLDPLVHIDLRPEKRVKVTITYGESSEIKNVDVYRTVIEFKSRIEKLVGLQANNMRLFYVDKDLRDLQGAEEMKYPHKQLYSYNIQSGDEIIIDRKK